jgi:uncharacterized protein (TIGR00288 family)
MEKDPIKNQRMAVLIDGANIYMRCLERNVRIDFSKLLERLKHRQIIKSIMYHVEVNAVREAGYVRRIRKMGYEVKIKHLKIKSDGRKKADMDVDIAIDAVCLADDVDVICILSGDVDYVPLIRYLKDRGVRTEVMGFEQDTSYQLKQTVDQFYPITKDLLLDNDSSSSSDGV